MQPQLKYAAYYLLFWALSSAFFGFLAIGCTHWMWHWGSHIFPAPSWAFAGLCAGIGACIGICVGILFLIKNQPDNSSIDDQYLNERSHLLQQKAREHTVVFLVTLLLSVSVGVLWSWLVYSSNVTAAGAALDMTQFGHYFFPVLACCVILSCLATCGYALFVFAKRQPNQDSSWAVDEKALPAETKHEMQNVPTYLQKVLGLTVRWLLRPLLFASSITLTLMAANHMIAMQASQTVLFPKLFGMYTALSILLVATAIALIGNLLYIGIQSLQHHSPKYHGLQNTLQNFKSAMKDLLPKLGYWVVTFWICAAVAGIYTVIWFHLPYDAVIPMNWDVLVLQITIFALIMSLCLFSLWQFIAPPALPKEKPTSTDRRLEATVVGASPPPSTLRVTSTDGQDLKAIQRQGSGSEKVRSRAQSGSLMTDL